jgi:hypothetical protein
MGKLTYAIMMTGMIELALYLFGGKQFSSSSLLSVMLNPTTLQSQILWSVVILGSLAAIAASKFVSGTNLFFNVYSMYAGIAAVFILFVWNIADLWSFINSQLSFLGYTSSGSIVTGAGVAATLITAPLFFFYLIAVLDWVRGTDQ